MRYAQWRRKDRGHPVAPEGVDLTRARAVVDRVLAAHPDGALLDREARTELLTAVGVPLLPRAEFAAGPDAAEEAVRAAERFAGPSRSRPSGRRWRAGRPAGRPSRTVQR